MDTGTIDQRIRQYARDELEAEVRSAFSKLNELFSGLDSAVRVDLHECYHNPNLGDFYAASVLKAVEEAVIAARTRNAEEAAVTAFLKRIEDLSAQVEDLQSQVET